jgi:DNA-binding PadR family transcriptional regulator
VAGTEPGWQYYVQRSIFLGMSRRSHADGELGRPNEPAVLILTSLASGPKHGYGLAQDIGQFAGVTLGPGTLYGAITRLEQGGFIEPVGEEERRRPYRITTSGRAALAKAVAEMRAIADEGAARLSLRSAGPAATGPGGGLMPGWTS